MIDDPARRLFGEEHWMYREQVRAFIEKEVVPHHERWEENGQVDRELWTKAGAASILCPWLSPELGGPGGDFLHSVVISEELGRVGATGPAFWLHSEMVAPYIANFGTGEQKTKWLPKFASGEVVSGVAMTEPSAGSDLRGMKTSANRAPGGWTLRGQKVFISNGQIADVFVVAAKTEEPIAGAMSLFLVDATSAGFRRGRNLSKIGSLAQDTSELFFDDLFVSDDYVLGKIGDGFKMLMHGLVRERLIVAVGCVAKAEHAFGQTVQYTKDRRLFGQNLADFQNTRFRLAELKTDLVVGRSFMDAVLEKYVRGELRSEDAASAKLWTSEMLGRMVDGCLQLHGGWGYMREYPIARAYVDARIERIAAGSSEVMKEIIGRSL